MKEILFWSKGIIEYQYLSHFYNCPITYKGITFPSAEHIYQWKKDPEAYLQLNGNNLSAKALKQASNNFRFNPEWKDNELNWMKTTLWLKFKQNKELAISLMNSYLESGKFIHDAPWDEFWGSGKKGNGLNMQGKLIQGIAHHLILEEASLVSNITVHNKATTNEGMYIGRGSEFGNPYPITHNEDRYVVIKKYAKYLSESPALIEKCRDLNTNLVCFCKPLDCHGDLLLIVRYMHFLNKSNTEIIKFLETFSDIGYCWINLSSEQNTQKTLF